MTGEIPVEHIVWDWNGTLFADGDALIQSTIDAFAATGLPGITRADYRRLHRQPIPAFYDALVDRTLTDTEQKALDASFQQAYLRRREAITLTHDAVDAMARWREAGGSQSLLSMYPHDRLLPLVEKFGIRHYFSRVDGLTDAESGRKAPHLRRHLDRLGTEPGKVLLIGDSVDDVLAASECGIGALLYHAGDNALHDLDHFTDLEVPVVESLLAAVSDIVTGARQQARPF
ncbi:HAD family hydrolase [Streptomyces populi]